ncbi:ankyrin repeat [Fusarium beomiforme]|uniref:Ankyrin repeat n=1 Tax=Fusarium beomiforme TaxID=44412 RepID=A0A9P5A7B3_9HYPO|nr:ankyrin repeat [Fusarium beomiforme]
MSPPNENWSAITDANERRKAQNRVAQRNYRSRQKLRVELADAILYDLPHWRSAVGLKGRRWLTAPQPEGQESEQDLPALSQSRTPEIGQHSEQGNSMKDPGAFPMTADSGNGDDADLHLGMFSPGGDWIDPQMDWTAAMSLGGESSTSQGRTGSPEGSIHASVPAPAPVTTTSPTPQASTRPVSSADVPPLAPIVTLAPQDLTRSSAALDQPPATTMMAAQDLTNRDKGREKISTIRRPPDSKTPLLTALSLGKLDIARLLIRSGAKIDAPDIHGKTNLHYAVQSGDAKMVRDLLELGADVLAADKAGIAALHMAVERDDMEMVTLLLRCCEEKDGVTPNPENEGMLQRCINSRDGQNMTPVHLCVVLERIEILKTLLQYGADVNIGCE